VIAVTRWRNLADARALASAKEHRIASRAERDAALLAVAANHKCFWRKRTSRAGGPRRLRGMTTILRKYHYHRSTSRRARRARTGPPANNAAAPSGRTRDDIDPRRRRPGSGSANRLVARRLVGRPDLIERGQGALALVLGRPGHRRQRLVELRARSRRLARPIIPRPAGNSRP
jgi:hypothetical protein